MRPRHRCKNCSVPVRARRKRVRPRCSAARQTPLLSHCSTASARVDPDVLICIMTLFSVAASSNYLRGLTPVGDTILAKGYLACFMDTAAEGLTFASFSPNHRESEA